MRNNTTLKVALLVVLATLVIVSVIVLAVNSGENHGDATTTPTTTTVTLGGSGKTKIPLDPKAQSILKEQKAEDASGDAVEAESNLHESTLPSLPAAIHAKSLQPPGQPKIPSHVPLAAASQPGCKTTFVRNYSSRRGAPILLGFIHWTGSPITPGQSGGLAIVRWFDTSASQASSDYVTDQEGRCWYTVPETSKAWTQAAANPWSLSVEIINPGVLPLFRTSAARNIVLKLMIGWHHRWKIPYQIGAVNSGCVPIRPGFLAHRDGGPCAGGHPDVGLPSVVPELVRQAAALDGSGGRAADLRARNKKAHHDIRAHSCSQTHPKAAICIMFVHRHQAIHKAAKKEHIKL